MKQGPARRPAPCASQSCQAERLASVRIPKDQNMNCSWVRKLVSKLLISPKAPF
jgi:hypothetical protein